MKYLMLLYFPDGAEVPEGGPEVDTMRSAYKDYADALRDHGVFLAGEALQPADIATTLRVEDGEAVVTDGPFVESAEILAGFYLCECRDLDHAMDVAAGIPGTRYGGRVEIRPVFDYEALVDA